MAGFEMTPMGIVPLGTPAVVVTSEPAPPIVHREPSPDRAEVVHTARPQVASVEAKAKPLTSKGIADMARARIKEIDKILRGVPALQAERNELAGIIAAAGAARRGGRNKNSVQ